MLQLRNMVFFDASEDNFYFNHLLYIHFYVHLLVVFSVVLSKRDGLSGTYLKHFLRVPVFVIISLLGALVLVQGSPIEEHIFHDFFVRLNLHRVRVQHIHSGVEHVSECFCRIVCTFEGIGVREAALFVGNTLLSNDK